jgi:HAD superfamily hydrolase (TIGR01490 family)
MKIASVFDFDNTLYPGESINDFMEYMAATRPEFTTRLIHKIKKSIGPFLHASKNYFFSTFNYLDEQDFLQLSHSFAYEILIPKLFETVVSKLIWHKEQGHTVIIISAGLDSYLNYVASHLQVKYCLASTVVFKKGKFNGIAHEMIGRQKVATLTSNFPEIDWSASYSYSDHPSDLPLLKLVGNPTVVISGDMPQWAPSNAGMLNPMQ